MFPSQGNLDGFEPQDPHMDIMNRTVRPIFDYISTGISQTIEKNHQRPKEELWVEIGLIWNSDPKRESQRDQKRILHQHTHQDPTNKHESLHQRSQNTVTTFKYVEGGPDREAPEVV